MPFDRASLNPAQRSLKHHGKVPRAQRAKDTEHLNKGRVQPFRVLGRGNAGGGGAKPGALGTWQLRTFHQLPAAPARGVLTFPGGFR